MRESLEERCQSFIENRNIIKSVFRTESAEMCSICAAIITDQGKMADPVKLRQAKDILKNQTGSFSNFRGVTRTVLICMLSVDTNPTQRLNHAQQVYNYLKSSLLSSQYLCVAAMIISDLVDPGYYKPMAEHTSRIYKLLKSKHPSLIGGEDSVFSALLAVSKKTDQRILEETEHCFALLRQRFRSKNAVHSLSHVLALCEGKPEEKCNRTIRLFDTLQSMNCRYGCDFELTTLGVLAMVDPDTDKLAEELRQVDQWLSRKRGYGLFGLSKRQRLMHASMILADDYLDRTSITQASITQTAVALAAAQQAAICAAIAATTIAATATG